MGNARAPRPPFEARGARAQGSAVVDAARMTRPRRPRGRVVPRMAPPPGVRSPARPASAAPR